MFTLTAPEFRPELRLAVGLAQRAGEEIMQFYKTDLKVDEKSDHTPITKADYAADTIIIEGLQKEFPYPILSEETAHDAARFGSEYAWIVDPLDGTGSFARGEDGFSVLIGLCRESEPIAGVAYFPARDTVYFAEKGKGAYEARRGEYPVRIHTSDVRSIPEARTLLSNKTGMPLGSLLEALGVTRIAYSGGFAGKVIAIAAGRADLQVNVSNRGSEWDTCAPEVIVREAGGIITDAWARPLSYNKEDPRRMHGEIIAANPALHQEVMNVLASEIQKIHAAANE